MDFESWELTVPATITGDALWKLQAYRLALFAADVAWADVTKLVRDGRTRSLSDQLFRAVGSIAANTSEGFSRGSSKDRTRFYEYALGSARETRGWYFKGRHVLGEDVAQERMVFLTRIVRLLLTMIPQQRGYVVKEDKSEYCVDPESSSD